VVFDWIGGREVELAAGSIQYGLVGWSEGIDPPRDGRRRCECDEGTDATGDVPGPASLRRARSEFRDQRGPVIKSSGPNCCIHSPSYALPRRHAQPGARWMYGAGAKALRAHLEWAAGSPLEAVLRERIFEPLGREDAAFSLSPAVRRRLTTAAEPDPETGERSVPNRIDRSVWGHPAAPRLGRRHRRARRHRRGSRRAC